MSVGLVLVAAAGAVAVFQPALVAPYLQGTPLELPATQTVGYKWRDANGHVQLSGTPPHDGTSYETITVSSKQNVMPLVPRE